MTRYDLLSRLDALAQDLDAIARLQTDPMLQMRLDNLVLRLDTCIEALPMVMAEPWEDRPCPQ